MSAIESTRGFWRVVEPDNWPEPPPKFSYSGIKAIETCPRKWALEHADYSRSLGLEVYPQRPSLQAMIGDTVHESLEQIVKAAQKARWAPSASAALSDVLKQLGGLRSVIDAAMAKVVTAVAATPRGAAIEGHLRSRLRLEAGHCRQQVQGDLARLVPSIEAGRGPLDAATGGPRDGRLGLGLHAEQWLEPATMTWHGKADVVLVAPSGTEIIDYKSGRSNPDDHREQLQLYALLWARDRSLNPSGQAPSRLRLMYSAGDVEVPVPSDAELDDLESTLQERAGLAIRSLLTSPPVAKPAEETCRYCGVRQLCGSFWTDSAPVASLEAPRVTSSLTSMEVLIRDERSDHLVIAEIRFCSMLPAGKRVEIERRSPGECQAGEIVRLIDVAVEGTEPDQPTSVRITSSSECYVVEDDVQAKPLAGPRRE